MTAEQIHVAAELTAWLVLSFATVIAAVVAYGFRRVATMYAHRADEVKLKYEQELERVLAAFETHQRALRRVERDRGHWRESYWQVQSTLYELQAFSQWRNDQEQLAAARGEPWSSTGPAWPTPEEMKRRESWRAIYEKHRHAEHFITDLDGDEESSDLKESSSDLKESSSNFKESS